MKTDIEIAHEAKMRNITEIGSMMGISPDDLELYGKYKAKIPLSYLKPDNEIMSKLILVSAISPTPAGEGKTTVSIGLAQALNRLKKQATVVLREPSLGPVFGIKGGAAGGGYSQVVPMEDINLHFTGDFSAIEKAHNLLAAVIDNNLQMTEGSLNLDPRTITWKRVMDMNDRSLRKIVIGLGGTTMGVPRETGFDITAASEIMAILCLSKDREDLKKRLGSILIGFTFDKKPVYAHQLNVHGAMSALLKDAIMPNLVQTLEGTPAIIHGGPFANIAQGTNSIIATKIAMSNSEYTVTEAGFGFDLGGEKFLDIKCREANIAPNAIVIVATIRALKYHGGAKLADLKTENLEALANGICNLEKHLENVKKFNITPVVAINKFDTDTQAELDFVLNVCKEHGVKAAISEGFAKGGEGVEELAKLVMEVTDFYCPNFKPIYDLNWTVESKIETIAHEIYGAKSVVYTPVAKQALRKIYDLGLDSLPICMAKTQKSLSDNPSLTGRPKDFVLTVREIEIAAGAGFIIPITGDMMRMPGLPNHPSSEKIDIDNDGNISGLF
ncbi:MAG: formate--tetrahydrofolate ligase [Bacteroidales bacterium]